MKAARRESQQVLALHREGGTAATRTLDRVLKGRVQIVHNLGEDIGGALVAILV